jgi:hypothetical protein
MDRARQRLPAVSGKLSMMLVRRLRRALATCGFAFAALSVIGCSSSKPSDAPSGDAATGEVVADSTAVGGCPSEPDCYRATSACGAPCTVCRYCSGGVWTENGDDCHFSCPDTGTSTTDVVAPTPPPNLDPPPGMYAAPLEVRITTPTPGGVFYYTLDGTIPTTSSPQYLAPIKLGYSVTLRAFANYPWGESPVVTAVYALTGDAGAYCGQLVAADGACVMGCHRVGASAMVPAEGCARRRYVCVSDESPDTTVILCRALSGTLYQFSDGHAADPMRDPGWRECTNEERMKIAAAATCAAEAGDG